MPHDANSTLVSSGTTTTTTTGSWLDLGTDLPKFGVPFVLNATIYGTTAGNTYVAVIQASADQTAIEQLRAFDTQTVTTATTSAATGLLVDQTKYAETSKRYIRVLETLGAGVTTVRSVLTTTAQPG